MTWEGIPLVGLTAPALLSITVLLLLTGKIVPRSALLDKQEETDAWREAYESERAARIEASRQSTELLEVAKTTHDVTVAMFKVVRVLGGDEDVPSLPKK